MIRLFLLMLCVYICTDNYVQAQPQQRTINGELKAGQKENVEEIQLKSGSVVMVKMNSKDFDTYIRLRDSNNKEVASDDDSGEGLNSRLTYMVPKDGTYRLVATSFGDNGVGAYTMAITQLDNVKPIGKPFTQQGKIEANSKQFQGLPYEATVGKMEKGHIYQIDCRSTAFDPILAIRLQGTEQPIEGDDDSGGDLNARVIFMPEQSGEYEVLCGSLNKKTGAYTLTIQEVSSSK